MKREFRTLIALSLTTISAAALPALAADAGTLRVTVPFTFTAGSATLPAGDYVISPQADSRILRIEGKGGSAILITMPQEPAADLKQASNLTFKRSSKGTALMEVQVSGEPSLIVNGGAMAGK